VRSKRLRKRALSGGRKIRSARKRVRRSSKQIGGTSMRKEIQKQQLGGGLLSKSVNYKQKLKDFKITYKNINSIRQIIEQLYNAMPEDPNNFTEDVKTQFLQDMEKYKLMEKYKPGMSHSENERNLNHYKRRLNEILLTIKTIYERYRKYFEGIPSCKNDEKCADKDVIERHKDFEQTLHVLKITGEITDEITGENTFTYSRRIDKNYPMNFKKYKPKFMNMGYLEEIIEYWPHYSNLPKQKQG